MATAAKKAKVDSTTPSTKVCPYGVACYRKNPAHFAEFSHPKDGASTSKLDASLDSAAASVGSSAFPPCMYGAKCYRKNLLHFAEYSHPTAGPTSDPTDSDGGDTDVYDSDDDKETKKDKNDILNRGMSLVKSFSQMTEQERKELIQKAFEVKQKLQEELAATKKKMEQKDKELNRLQEEVNKGILLVEGEEEAMKGDKTVYFPLVPERDYKEGSADQIHFRLAESQFYRLISGAGLSTFRVTKVEYVVTPDHVKRFKTAKEKLHKERGEDMACSVLAFHGTDEKNITLICEKGFKVPGESGFHHKTDTGWYGAGVYFSEYPSYSMSYISGSTKLLLCQVLPGKVYNCPGLIHGAKLQKGYDSHMSPCKKELIIFNSHHILPCYVVHYTSASSEFKYKKFTRETKRKYAKAFETSSEELKKKRTKAFKAPKSNVLNGLTVKYIGPKSEETEFYKLVMKHMGTKEREC
ncbi:uncharacterized protein [Littorina saxatilis]|uniref:uncharacterized protein isoform X2 n=1 Tax=Littorina saxatilis TaxID=31220 RepID=UPI0038B4C4FB